jgi:translation elongation factor EF-4
MSTNIKRELETYCELHWWNMGKKTLSHQGTLRDLLAQHKFRYTKKKSEHQGLFNFTFKNEFGITYKARGVLSDFKHFAKQAIQMELVRMGDKSQLYVTGCWRPLVTINK